LYDVELKKHQVIVVARCYTTKLRPCALSEGVMKRLRKHVSIMLPCGLMERVDRTLTRLVKTRVHRSCIQFIL